MGYVKRLIRSKLPPLYFKVDPNSTHRDFLETTILFLLEKLQPSEKLIMLEIGTGGSSSEIMRKVLESNEKTALYSFENDKEWYETYQKNYEKHDRHINLFVENEDWNSSLNQVLKSLKSNCVVFAFIDSSPWSSRIEAMNSVKSIAHVFLIHDVDYFPHNNYFGTEDSPIKFSPRNPFIYGKLKSSNLGMRNYDDIAESWVEIFPQNPGYFTGPPTLVASDVMNVLEIEFPRSSTIQSQSKVKRSDA
jgi:hypothetical protein